MGGGVKAYVVSGLVASLMAFLTTLVFVLENKPEMYPKMASGLFLFTIFLALVALASNKLGMLGLVVVINVSAVIGWPLVPIGKRMGGFRPKGWWARAH
jgi:hypothetical protein